ncbi:MAG: S1 RNA-binding domain-containing protein [Candidatus Muiribacteriota bacterium]
MEENNTKQMMEEALSRFENISRGNIVKGTVVKKTPEELFVDIGYKSEGKIKISEFETNNEIPEEGQEIKTMVIRLDDAGGSVILSYKEALRKEIWEKLIKANVNEESVKGTINRKIKGGYQVLFDNNVTAFLPRSQVGKIEGKAEGTEKNFLIIEINKKSKNIVVSNRALEDKKKEEAWENIFEGKEKGDLVSGKVSNIKDYGAFIDFGGVEGLLHITDISWGRINKVTDILNAGDDVEGVILDLDKEKFRISVGLKQKTPEPWSVIDEKFYPGEVIEGEVKSIMSYGAFIEITPGLEGLLHVSDMSWKKVASPSEIIKKGEKIKVKILEIDSENKKIALGIKQLTPDPWQKIEELCPLNSLVEGVISKIINSGAFLDIGNGLEGFIHVSDMSWSRKNAHPSEFVGNGERVKAVVLEVSREERKLKFGIKQTTPDPWINANKKYKEGEIIKTRVTGLSKFGAFLELEEGIEGLLHISDFSWTKKVNNPADVLKVGEEIKAQIISADFENRKIALGLKQLQKDPLQILTAKYPEGEIIEGTVKNIKNFGIFVEIEDGVEGLVHVSDISWTEKVNNPAELFSKDEKIKVKVLSYDLIKRQIALGIKQLEEDPFLKYTQGINVKCKVKEILKYGIKVELEKGINGFIHISELSDERIENAEEVVKPEEEIEARIIENQVDERNIKLSLKEAQFGKVAKEFLIDNGDEEAGGVSVGDKLKKAMKKKDS